MKKIVALSLIVLSMLQAGEITIAVAANVSYAIDELKKEFIKTHPDIRVKVILGSSGKLTAQIKNGAPYGLFMAANMKYPKALYEEKIALSQPVVYAQGALALFSTQQQSYSKGIALLTEHSVKKIAVANPKTAPYGKAAIEAMKNADVYLKIKNKFVFAESISQTITYTMTAVDMGLIAKSSLYTEKMKKYKEGIHWIDVDSKLYTPIKQGMVLLQNGKNNDDYRTFYDFILSSQAKEILNSYGYIVKI